MWGMKTILSERDFDILAKAIKNPPEPNDALISVFREDLGMSDAKFTPGPWHVEKDCAWCAVMAENGYAICALSMDTWEAETEDNADILSSAPDLYAALEAVEWRLNDEMELCCIKCHHTKDMGHAAGCIIGNALAKARGDEPC